MTVVPIAQEDVWGDFFRVFQRRKCQKSKLTKFSPVRFVKFGQIQFLTLDSVSPINILGKIHPGFKPFKLAQKSCRKPPAVQISKSVHKECAPF